MQFPRVRFEIAVEKYSGCHIAIIVMIGFFIPERSGTEAYYVLVPASLSLCEKECRRGIIFQMMLIFLISIMVFSFYH